MARSPFSLGSSAVNGAVGADAAVNGAVGGDAVGGRIQGTDFF